MNEFSKFYNNNHDIDLKELVKIKKKKFNDNSKNIKKITDEIFKQLIKIFKNKNKSNRKLNNIFWKIYLYPWVFFFVSFTLDRYNLVKQNKDKKVKFKKKINLRNLYFSNCNEFHSSLRNNLKTNFYFCNFIFNLIKKKKNFFYYQVEKSNQEYKSSHFLFLKFLKFFDFKIGYSIRTFNIKSFILNILYYKIIQIPTPRYISNTSIDQNFRNKININFKQNSEFKKVLKNLLPLVIPKSFIEDFSNLKNNIDNYFPKNANKIFSENFVLNEDQLRMWLAISKVKKTKLFFFQHGGAYTDKINSLIELEYKLSDKHYIFARKIRLKEKQFTDKVFLRIKNINQPTTKKILLPVTDTTNFNKNYEFPSPSDYILCYKEIYNFIENLHPSIQNKLIIRFRPNTKKNFFFYKILKKKFPKIYIQIPNKGIQADLKSSLLFINSINSTTFMQALLSGIPTLSILNKNYFLPKKKYKKYYDYLKKNNLLFTDGITAAKFLNKKFYDKKFWYSSKYKYVISHFIKNIIYKNE